MAGQTDDFAQRVDSGDGNPDAIVGSQHSPGSLRPGKNERRQCAASNGAFQEFAAMMR